jgi:recombination protein RecR
MAKYPKDLLILIHYLQKLPGVGSKTAERFAFHLLKWDTKSLKDLSQLLSGLKEKITTCPSCGCLILSDPCYFCNPKIRDTKSICIISSPKDAFMIEETRTYRGLYHVIDHLLSPLDGIGQESLHLERLTNLVKEHKIEEAVLALDSTLEGDATSLFLKKELNNLGVRVFRLAFGMPVGSSFEYVDGGTLSRALLGKQSF